MGVFDDLAVRGNNQTVDASWWNSIRTALISAFGSGYTALTQFTIANNQASFTNVTGLLLDGSSIKTAFIEFRIRRATTGAGATELIASGTMLAAYKPTAATWELVLSTIAGDVGVADPEDMAGVLFQITTAGQVQYKSHNISGTASESILNYTIRTLS